MIRYNLHFRTYTLALTNSTKHIQSRHQTLNLKQIHKTTFYKIHSVNDNSYHMAYNIVRT